MGQGERMKRFGEKLRTLRQRRGWTLRELATLLEMGAHSHLANLETGKNKPTAELILKIAELFAVSTDQLMKDELELD
jgi:transcriptional regulator with XRE-family HTH domain